MVLVLLLVFLLLEFMVFLPLKVFQVVQLAAGVVLVVVVVVVMVVVMVVVVVVVMVRVRVRVMFTVTVMLVPLPLTLLLLPSANPMMILMLGIPFLLLPL